MSGPHIYPVTLRLKKSTDKLAEKAGYFPDSTGKIYRRRGVSALIKQAQDGSKKTVDAKYKTKYGPSWERKLTKVDRINRENAISRLAMQELRKMGMEVGTAKVTQLDMKKARDKRYLAGKLRSAKTTRRPVGYILKTRLEPHERLVARPKIKVYKIQVGSGKQKFRIKRTRSMKYYKETYYKKKTEAEIVFITGYATPRIKKDVLVYVYFEYDEDHEVQIEVHFSLTFGVPWRPDIEKQILDEFKRNNGNNKLISLVRETGGRKTGIDLNFFDFTGVSDIEFG